MVADFVNGMEIIIWMEDVKLEEVEFMRGFMCRVVRF